MRQLAFLSALTAFLLGAFLLGATPGFAEELPAPGPGAVWSAPAPVAPSGAPAAPSLEAEAHDFRKAIDVALLASAKEDARRLERNPWPIGGAGKAYENPWSFEVGLAASLARGNTDTLDVLADGKVNYERNKVKAEVKLAYVYGEAAGVKTADNAHAQARLERSVGGRSFIFGRYNYDQDEFASLDYRHTGLLGYGRTLVDTEKTKLSVELGGGMAWEQRVDLPPTANPSAYLGVDFAHEWGEGNTFTLDYDFIPYLNNFDLSFMTWNAKFGTPLCKGLDLTVGVRVGWVFAPPAPTKAVDLLLAVGLRLKL